MRMNITNVLYHILVNGINLIMYVVLHKVVNTRKPGFITY